jgi:hypothetical protein
MKIVQNSKIVQLKKTYPKTVQIGKCSNLKIVQFKKYSSSKKMYFKNCSDFEIVHIRKRK